MGVSYRYLIIRNWTHQGKRLVVHQSSADCKELMQLKET